ncbi:LOW QUALITY PROTEIN: hypothetical protein T552_04193 [Pneumocystis carinii B80]|uniref:Uncharacterized protein n=1 Tax=Pneumocystis carinii (strain B80) TaxID=1408658 RepID=A0A0W4ZCH9_PNEC8|nr:LOW QUALITY PROTEIN: hypothetical protein T552_04193 [Pneumocystis carinii B80]KTW26102.1 LOW QUALITY PROTEIN: hypothetical protein T552_04193 [Pneumocystis carinii B80]
MFICGEFMILVDKGFTLLLGLEEKYRSKGVERRSVVCSLGLGVYTYTDLIIIMIVENLQVELNRKKIRDNR